MPAYDTAEPPGKDIVAAQRGRKRHMRENCHGPVVIGETCVQGQAIAAASSSVAAVSLIRPGEDGCTTMARVESPLARRRLTTGYTQERLAEKPGAGLQTAPRLPASSDRVVVVRAADVLASRMRPLATAPRDGQGPSSVLLLDRVTTPANIGMILRTVTAAGVSGIVLPRRGVTGINPLVVKASAGVAFHAPVLRCGTAAEAAWSLTERGYPLLGLAAGAPRSLFSAELDEMFGGPVAFVLGAETNGVSEAVGELVSDWVSIPMAGGIESLNVASAAAVLCFELVRRRG